MPSSSGPGPNQTPTGKDLGGMAYQSPEAVTLRPQAIVTPAMVGEMVFQLTNNTTLAIKVRCLDNVVRTTTLTLA